jgi:polyphosphate glucokinase
MRSEGRGRGAGRPIRPSAPGRREEPRPTRTLAVDVGGSGIKAGVLTQAGGLLGDRVRIDTPVGRHPRVVVRAVSTLVRPLPPFDRVSVGFPGVVAAGRVLTAPNLGHGAWLGFDLAGALRRRFRRPARIANDVTLQGLAVIIGRGLELVITLGTGVGSALFLDGLLVPQFMVGHQILRKGHNFDEQLNGAALEAVGDKKWNRRLEKALRRLPQIVRYDRLYIGGGNAKRIRFPVGPRTIIVSNEAGIRGGIALWGTRYDTA